MRVNFRRDYSLFEDNGEFGLSWESPICSRRGIRREIRYRAAPGFFSADTKARCDRRRIPAKLLPTGNSRIFRCRTRARRTLEIGIVEKRCQEEAGDEIGPTTRTGGGIFACGIVRRTQHAAGDTLKSQRKECAWMIFHRLLESCARSIRVDVSTSRAIFSCAPN